MHATWRYLAQLILWAVMLFAVLVLIGGYMDWMVLRGSEPGDVKVCANTAFCLLLSCLAALLFALGKKSKILIFAAYILSSLVFLVGSLTLIQYFGGYHLGVDQLLFASALGARLGSSTVFIQPITAFNFMLIGAALILHDFKVGANFFPSQMLLAFACLLSQLTVIGFAYGVPVLYELDRNEYIASPNGLVFLLLCAGILLLWPERGAVALLASDSLGGRTARTLLPACVMLPVVLGAFRQMGAKLGGVDFASILIVFLGIFALPCLVYWHAKKLDELEQEKPEG